MIFAALALSSIVASSSRAAEVVDTWRYTTREPKPGWEKTDFDAGSWKEGTGGFGTRGTPGARISTIWNTPHIWLRKARELERVPSRPALLIHHDEDVEVYVNGRQVFARDGFTTEYETHVLDAAARDVLRAGKNILAVHCQQTGGGQFIDVHLVDANNVPNLPPAEQPTTPFKSELITQWGESLTADNAWTEYPRPQLVRERWQNLNGHWDYAVTSEDRTAPPEDWAGKILVPFCLESKLSGVQRLLNPAEVLWYRRTFEADPLAGNQVLLNFEAVDYRCEVTVNGQRVGTHRGGNTPFSFDVTEALREGSNELVVRVHDDTEGWQLRGKQVLNPRGIWYTRVSGIWQTVWMEQVSSSYLEDVKISTDADKGLIRLQPVLGGEAQAGKRLTVVVKDGGQTVAEVTEELGSIAIALDKPKLWSPNSPHLYDLEITLLGDNNRVLDRVRSYAGIRSVGKQRDADGHWRFTLNGQPIFHWGPLDQGWWPDGLLTPPADEAMLLDITFLKSAGFNMIRNHIKVKPRRYYYHCDRLGMMIWQDHVSAGNNAPWTRLKEDPQDAQWPDEHHQQFMLELERMIDTLENHPCIVVWVPFNEAWGQHRTMEVGKWVLRRDPTRLMNIASGGNFWPVGDIVDAHQYPHPGFPFAPDRFSAYIKVIGEFGGHGFPIRGHLWDAQRRNWGYGGLPQSKVEYKQRYVKSLNMLDELRQQGIAAGVYTQTTDVEGEINGLMTYDRKVIKIPAEELADLHKRLFKD